jgi:hypothetical protein
VLQASSSFYRQDDDTTAVAGVGAMLEGLDVVGGVLAEGAHNQFGDLPSTARIEMLIEMWLLARPEVHDSLGERNAAPYPEPWMANVDRLKTLRGWNRASIREFHTLGVCAERLVLSIREDNRRARSDSAIARNWARFWRPEIQQYLHAYRAVTGVDLT